MSTSKYNVTCPAYIGDEKNQRGNDLCLSVNIAVDFSIRTGDSDVYQTYKEVLEYLVTQEDIKKYGIIIVGVNK